jgi:hypothetical protein
MRKHIGLVLALFALSGCAASLDYGVLGGHMEAGDCPAAAEYVSGKEKRYGANGRLLFLLDAAQVSMLCGRYEDSNRYFHEAEDLAEDLWTRSITMEAAAFITNDYALPYDGEDFERALINLFSAINYSMLGQTDEALVECRRLDAKLNLYNDKYESRNVYKEDAFDRYLSGIIYESEGSLDDAYIDYYKAYKVYRDYDEHYGTPVPEALAEDVLRVARTIGRLGEAREELGLSGREKLSYRKTRKMGKVVFIHLNGLAPEKREDSVFVYTKSGPVKIAFPRMAVSRPFCDESEDVNRIAVKNLEDRKGRIMAKTIARAVVKQAAIHGAANQIKDDTAREATKLLMNIINIAVERADTRAWRTLPGEIYMSRAYVPEGRYGLSVRMCDQRRLLEPIKVKAGETRFVLYQTMY